MYLIHIFVYLFLFIYTYLCIFAPVKRLQSITQIVAGKNKNKKENGKEKTYKTEVRQAEGTDKAVGGAQDDGVACAALGERHRQAGKDKAYGKGTGVHQDYR